VLNYLMAAVGCKALAEWIVWTPPWLIWLGCLLFACCCWLLLWLVRFGLALDEKE